MKRLILILAFLPSMAFALPAAISEPMGHMCQTDNLFVRQAIMRELRVQYPAYDAEIVQSWPSICSGQQAEIAAEAELPIEAVGVSTEAEAEAEETELNVVEPDETAGLAAIPSVVTGFRGQLEAGASLQSGNTESLELNLQARGEQELENWRHHFEAAAFNSKEEGERNDEEYRLGFGSDWKVNARDYFYGKIRYVDDRFAGFDYRISESVGVGRRWIDDEVYLLDTRIGPGLRQTKFTNGQTENSWIIVAALQAGWVINEYVELGEDLEAEYSPDGTIINFDSWAKSKLTEDLSLKAGLNVEYKSDPPVDAESTDTRTTLGIVYGF